LLHLLLALPLTGASTAAPEQTSPPPPQEGIPTDPDEQVRMLLGAIRRKKDDTIERQFKTLARVGTKRAFEGLKQCVEWLNRPRTLFFAYKNFREFEQDPVLSREAIEYLADQALEASKPSSRAQAARALARWGELAFDPLVQLVEEGKDRAVRGHAVSALLPHLFHRGDEEALRLIVRNIAPEDTYRLAGNLTRFTGTACRGIFKDLVLDKRHDPHLRALVIDHLATLEGEDIDRVLARLVSARDGVVQVAAIDGLSGRGATRIAKDRLWKLMTSRKLDVRFAALQALGKLLVDDEKWVKRVFQLSRNRDPNARMGAVHGLYELGTEPAVERIYELLSDENWRVRASALKNVEKLRRPRSVELLIERLSLETGRLRVDVARTLQRVTGERLGAAPGRWRAWWEDHREGYVVPKRSEADDPLERGALERKAVEGASVATFYGLPVFSDHATFVMDISGSMSQKTGEGEYSSGGRTSRHAVARAQLKKMLEQIPDGHFCNVIFFNDEPVPWREQQEELTEKTREDLVAFIDSVLPAGGTNLFDTIELAMEDPLCDTVYILSDGQPTAGSIVQLDGIRRRVLQLNRSAQLQFYGVSVGLVSELFEDLSDLTNGRYVELGISAREASQRARDILLREDASEKELERALARAEQAARLDPREAEYRTILGVARFRTGDPARARTDLEASAGLEGSGEMQLKATRLVFLARILLQEDELEAARSLLVEAETLLADFRASNVHVFLEWAQADMAERDED